MELALSAKAENSSRRIFIVDDEEPIRKVLETHLKKEGFRVLLSPGGHGVFDQLKANSFELLICDIKMPDVDGLRVLEFVRTNFDTVPVIMLTGLTDVSVAVEVMKKGAFDYIIKPVRKDDLLSTIGRALTHRDLLVRARQLEHENREYQLYLEDKVKERTLEVKKAYDTLKSMNFQFVNVLAETIEAKDHYTRGHCNRMRRICVELGTLLGLSRGELEVLEYASLLHDIGKISVNELILNKEGPLTEEESSHIREHPEIGERILKGIPFMEKVAEVIAAHHENYDGSGYPRGLKAEGIPISSRIIAVADIFDAMTSDRPYRKALQEDVAIREMMRVAGTQLDPAIVGIFVTNVDNFLRLKG